MLGLVSSNIGLLAQLMMIFHDFIGSIPSLILRWGRLKALLFALFISSAIFTLVRWHMSHFGTTVTVRVFTAA